MPCPLRPLLLLSLSLALPNAARAQEAEAWDGETGGAGKSQYTLFNPVPEGLMRPFTSDRPHATESPFTVDAGHLQIESGLLSYALSQPDLEGAATQDFGLVATNFRIGVMNSAEIDFILQPYGIAHSRTFGGQTAQTRSGIGGAQIRAKLNLWGDDSYGEPGSSAFALLPFVSLPTDRTNGVSPSYVEGGAVGLFEVKLTDIISLEINDGVLYLRDGGDPAYHAELLTTANIEFEWTETFGTYYEVVAQLGRNDPMGDIAFVGTGATYLWSENMQLDAGVNLGITPAAGRINPFIGLTMRF